jgi:tetratricopeptide (TPR) repeat protein
LSSPVPHDASLVRKILDDTAQTDLGNSTLYSLEIDLSAGALTLFYDRRFGTPVEMNLMDELRAGARVVDMATLVPPSLTDEILNHGIGASRDRLSSMAADSARELSRTGYELLRREKVAEALEVFRIANKELHTAASYSDLANAYNFAGQPEEARRLYQRALSIDGSDYSANLMGAGNGVVTFRLKAFEFASSVSVQASFDGHDAKALPLEKIGDEWFGSVTLPKGKYFYSFQVDDSWSTDPKNGLSAKPGRYFSSVLIVR